MQETEACLFFSRLLRDADKLDIWKVVTDYYHRKDGRRHEALELNLPDTEGFSREVHRDIMNRTIIDMRHVKNMNDFKLLQAGWIFDVNFKPTLISIRQRRYLELIRDALPQSKDMMAIFETLQNFLAERMRLTPDAPPRPRFFPEG